MELSNWVERTKLSARDIRDLTHDAEPRAITDCNSQLLFLLRYTAFEWGLTIN